MASGFVHGNAPMSAGGTRAATRASLRVLSLVQDAETLRLALGELAAAFQVEHQAIGCAAELHESLQAAEWDLLLLDPAGGDLDPRAVFERVHETGGVLVAVAVTQTEDERQAEALLAAGARAVLGRARLGRLVPIVEHELAVIRRRKERELRALIESSPDPMLIASPDGRIVHVNHLLEQLLGYPAAELTGQPLELLVPEHLRERYAAHRARYASHPQPRPMRIGLELSARHKNGEQIPVEISLSPVRVGGEQLVCCGIRDLRERIRAERLLRAILEGTAAETAEAFLRALVRNLAEALGVRHAFVSELQPQGPGRLQVLAFWSRGGFAEPQAYDAQPGPCGTVLEQGELYVPSGVCARYRDDARLQALGCEGFFGVRLQAASGEPLGVLAIADSAPLGH